MVSIILPTFNRARFLAQAFASIADQTFRDCELIVVDDGSIDDTSHLVRALESKHNWSVRYVYQENRGAAAARNSGLDLASGEYVAFFDSDDTWLPHHLDHCVDALKRNPDVDWVFSATRGISVPDGRVLWESSFYHGNRPRPFLSLRTHSRSELNVIDDPKALQFAILHGFDAGLQVSLFRKRIFNKARLPPIKIGEDQVFLFQSLARGIRLAYFDRVHTIYHVHDENLSLASAKPTHVRVALLEEMTRGIESLRLETNLTRRDRRALNRRLSAEYFWHMGYPLAEIGDYDAAISWLWRGLRLTPWNLFQWKTLVLAAFRHRVGRTTHPHPASMNGDDAPRLPSAHSCTSGTRN